MAGEINFSIRPLDSVSRNAEHQSMGISDISRRPAAALAAFLLRVYFEIWGTTAVAAVIGILNDIPLFYLFIALVFTSAMTMTLLVKYEDWREKTSARYKLADRKCRFGFLYDESGRVDSVQLGFNVRNRARFPLRVEVESLYTSLCGRHPPKKEPVEGQIVPAKSTAAFNDHHIDLEDLPMNSRTAEGTIRARVRYGKVDGKLAETLEFDRKIFIYFDRDGQMDSVRLSHGE